MSAHPKSDYLQDRRRRVGFVTVICGCLALGGFVFASPTELWPAAAMRIGIVFGSLWLCFPSGNRRAAWAVLTPTRLFILAIFAWYGRRLMVFLPAVASLLLVLRILRPRQKQ